MNVPARVGAAIRRRWFQRRCRREGRSLWHGLDGFCLFVGYGRSGHSAVASIVDAHPRSAVSHELDAVGRFRSGISREELFADIVWLAGEQARTGRTSPHAGGGLYHHRIRGQRAKEPRELLLIGDQRGARTLRAFARDGFDGIDRFRHFVEIPVRMLHVIRNPFDIVAAGLARGSTGFPELVALATKMRQRYMGAEWLDVYLEDLIAAPRQETERIVAFLGLPASDMHAASCEAYLFPTPHRRRFEVEWPSGVRTTVERLIQHHDFLQRYEWDS